LQEFKEPRRFETLFNFFRFPAEFHIDFMTACMKFINVLVHSTEDGNQRVALQYEFTCLGLDRYLEDELVYEESELLLTHVNSYRSNRISVDQLIADANHRMELLEQVAFLEGMNSAVRIFRN
jgi:formic-like protein